MTSAPKHEGFRDYFVDNDTCLSAKRANATAISNVYEGIPETLLLNVIAWLFLLLLFAILRNRAWDYGRLALVHNDKWTQLFYKNTEDAVAVEESNVELSLNVDTGCQWFPSIFKINMQRLIARCGPDASHYVSFQHHLLLLSTAITIFAICVILPINFQGTLQGDSYTFGHTTLSNLEPNSKWLWVHVIASFCFVPLTILIMRRCSGQIPSGTVVTSRTIMITHISRNHRNTEDIRNYFSVRYPDLEIKDIQIAYKIKKLSKLEKQREQAHEARVYCMTNHKTDMLVQPRGCIVCCPWKTVNARDYYSQEEDRLTNLVLEERRKALDKPLGIAFVTLESEDAAEYVVQSFRPGTLRNWNIVKAPSPSDIQWENLEISTRNWYLKAIIINLILFIVLFFLTTPAIVVNLFNSFTAAQENFIRKLSPVLSEFLPTLLLLSMSALMPVIVAYSDEWMSHWTKSKQNLATMHKTFFFLLFMVLILPSLGLTSAQAFVQWSLQPKNITLRWECVFLADKGAFFVNYVITSALIGTALELLRFPELAMYVWRLLRIKSEAEKVSIRKEILSEFPFGIHYTWTLLIFTISTVYSLTCPLITPFGLLYLCLKHLVDKHNIYYVYRPISMCGEGQQIHASAVRMVRVAVALLQLIMTAFAIIRGGLGIMSIIMIFGFVSTLGFLSILSPFPTCRPKSMRPPTFPHVKEQYVSPVLLTSQHVQEDNYVVTTPGYGSSNINDVGVRMIPEIGSSVA